MNEFDQWVKNTVKAKYYIRYADDFVIMSTDRKYLENIVKGVSEFLETRLKLSLHPDKVSIKTFASGVDFLGWVHFSNYRVLRTTTKKRMFKKLDMNNYKEQSLSSYLGMLGHGNTYKLEKSIESLLSILKRDGCTE